MTLTDDMLNELFTRLRETEAQTREQQVRINSLVESIKTSNDNTALFIKHLDEREERTDRREKNLMKIIYILIGAVIALAVGPRVAKDLITDATKIPIAHVEAIPFHPHTDWTVSETAKAA